jgi:sulfhydrogenase subunit alpha
VGGGPTPPGGPGMTQGRDGERTIQVGLMARVEGEGALRVTVRNGEVRDVELRIFEPPRFFEAFLRGRHFQELPDLVARICGICPVAYQMSAVHALEAIFGVSVGGALRDLRRLLYCGEWIESHALHLYLLQAPDFLGYESGIAMARDHRDAVTRGLRLKKAGNRILEVLGGRSVHPVSVRVGGFSRVPRRGDLLALRDDLRWALDAAADTVGWVAGFDGPDFVQDYTFVALAPGDEYPLNEGLIASSRGLRLDAGAFDAHFAERQVPHSTALHCTVDGEAYLAGPLARLHHNAGRLTPRARAALAATGLPLGPWRSSSPSRRRWTSSIATSRRRRRRSRCRSARGPERRARRRPAACSTTATRWMRTG